MNKELVVLSYLCSTLFLLWSHVTHLFIWTHLGSCNWIYPASIYSLNVHHIFSPISKATHESHTPSYFPFHVGPQSNTSWSNSLSPNYLLFYLPFLRSWPKAETHSLIYPNKQFGWHFPFFVAVGQGTETARKHLFYAILDSSMLHSIVFAATMLHCPLHRNSASLICSNHSASWNSVVRHMLLHFVSVCSISESYSLIHPLRSPTENTEEVENERKEMEPILIRSLSIFLLCSYVKTESETLKRE